MPAQNLLSEQITPEALQKIEAAIDSIEAELDFRVSFSRIELQRMTLMGDKSRAFVHKALDYARSHPEFLPTFIRIEEFEKDVRLADQIDRLLRQIEPLLGSLRHTRHLAGNEAYKAALAYYQATKQAKQLSVLSASTIAEDLAQRFPAGARRKSSKPDA